MRNLIIWAGVAWLSAIGAVSAAEIPGSTIAYNHWSGGGYTDDKTGSFSHCAVGSAFVSGISLTFAVQSTGAITIGFFRPEWSFKLGEVIDGNLKIDRRYSASVKGVAVSPKLVKIDFLVTDPIFDHLEHGYILTITSSIGSASFSLKDSYRALQLAKNCATKYLAMMGGRKPIPELQKWLARNAWFSNRDFAEQQRAVITINNEMVAEGKDLNSAAFYEELDRRIRQAGIKIPQPPAPVAAPSVPATPAASPSIASPQPPPKKEPKLVPVSGSGVIVSLEGYVATNEHVVGDCVTKIEGALPGDAPVELRIVNLDRFNDLALLKGPSTFKVAAAIRGRAIRPGDAIIAIGYPYPNVLSSEFTVTTGIISSLGGIGNDSRYLQISAPVQPGNSGGPLLDTHGNLVGIVAEKLDAVKMMEATGSIPENINFAIKTGALRDFLDKNVVNYEITANGSEKQTAEVAALARAYTMRISCTAKSTQ